MKHVVHDGFHAFRSRLDDYRLVDEVLAELPGALGVEAVMPPMLIPYYNGVRPEDCGISAFVFLLGGHITIHTFSFREAIFADILSPQPFSERVFLDSLQDVFPCKTTTNHIIDRTTSEPFDLPSDPGRDFGPHLFFDFDDRTRLASFESAFQAFDTLPGRVGMTPIMRPYVVKSSGRDGEIVLSAMTMIAESHISLHVFESARVAYFDLFSCSFFDRAKVTDCLLEILGARAQRIGFLPRGRGYTEYRVTSEQQAIEASDWTRFAIGQNRPGTE